MEKPTEQTGSSTVVTGGSTPEKKYVKSQVGMFIFGFIIGVLFAILIL